MRANDEGCNARGESSAFGIEEDGAVVTKIAALDRIPEMCRVVCARVCKRQGHHVSLKNEDE